MKAKINSKKEKKKKIQRKRAENIILSVIRTIYWFLYRRCEKASGKYRYNRKKENYETKRKESYMATSEK